MTQPPIDRSAVPPWPAASHPPPPPPPAPHSPRRGRIWFVLGVVAIAAVGSAAVLVLQAQDDDGDDPVDASERLSLDDLEPALLTEDEVGEGFTATDGPGTSDEGGNWEMSEECLDVLGRTGIDPTITPDWLQAEFRQGAVDNGATLAHSLSLVEDDTPTLTQMADAMEQCGTMTSSFDDDGELTIRLTPEDLDGPGDEAIGYDIELHASYSFGEVTYDGYAVMSTRGGVDSSVSMFGAIAENDGEDPGGQVDVETEAADRHLVRRLAETADGKLHNLLGD